MAWALVAHAKSGIADGGAGPFRGPTGAGTVNAVGADLYVVAVAHYDNNEFLASALTDVSGNTYTKFARQTAVGDSNTCLTWLYKIAPVTSAIEAWLVTRDAGARPSNGGVCAAAFSGCAATPTITHTESGATTQNPHAGSLGSAGDLVVTAVSDYTATVSSIGSSFAITDSSPYTSANNIGIALAWCNLSGGIAGAVDPTWTMSATPSAVVVQALSFTGTGGGGGGGGVTYPQLERGIRGLERGLSGGLARSFVKRDRIFVPAYATYDLKAAA